jgi:hypothetical protein
MNTPVRAVPLLEVCKTMEILGYFESAQAAISAFIAMLESNSQFAVVAYGDDASLLYPKRGLSDWTTETVTDCIDKVMAAEATGEVIDMSAGIERAARVLNEGGVMLLMADGMWDSGTDPLDNLPVGIPIYTFALGDNGQIELLRQIATRTHGRFSFIADSSALGALLVDVLEWIGSGTVNTVAVRTLSAQRHLAVVATVQPGTTNLKAGLSWNNLEIQYSNTSPPGSGQVSLTVLDPDGNPVDTPPLFAQDGFAVISIDEPTAGSWYLTATFGGPDTLTVTLSAVTPPVSSRFEIDAPSTVKAGENATIRARFDSADASDSSLLAFVSTPSAVAAAGSGPAPRHTVPAEVRGGGDEREIIVRTSAPGEYLVTIEAMHGPAGKQTSRTRTITLSAV